MLSMLKTANVCLMLEIYTLCDLFSKHSNYSSHWLSASILSNFFGWKSLFHFFVAVVYYIFLQEQLYSNVAAQ